MKIEVLMSTMDRKNIKELMLKDKNVEENVLIINQTEKESISLNKDGIRMLNFNEQGLARSRNRAIDNAIGDICLFADDDIVYKKDIFRKIEQAFLSNPEFDVITFKFGNSKKNYKQNPFIHNYKTISMVSSIEIAFRRQSIIKNNIRFDDLFGLGSKYISGEENIFLKDCLDKKLRAMFIPLTIVVHPDKITTGKKWSKELLMSKGALFYRIYGKLSFVINLFFCIKKYNEYKINLNFINSLICIYKGTFDYRKTIKNKFKNK